MILGLFALCLLHTSIIRKKLRVIVFLSELDNSKSGLVIEDNAILIAYA